MRAIEIQDRLRLELACALYQRELASFGSAAGVAGVHPFVFGHELTRRGIARHYGEAEMADDDAYVEALGRSLDRVPARPPLEGDEL